MDTGFLMRTLVALLLLTTAASAQQYDPAFIAKVVPSLQQQRNQALDLAAVAETREALLKEEIARLKAELEKAKAAQPAEPQH